MKLDLLTREQAEALVAPMWEVLRAARKSEAPEEFIDDLKDDVEALLISSDPDINAELKRLVADVGEIRARFRGLHDEAERQRLAAFVKENLECPF